MTVLCTCWCNLLPWGHLVPGHQEVPPFPEAQAFYCACTLLNILPPGAFGLFPVFHCQMQCCSQWAAVCWSFLPDVCWRGCGPHLGGEGAGVWVEGQWCPGFLWQGCCPPQGPPADTGRGELVTVLCSSDFLLDSLMVAGHSVFSLVPFSWRGAEFPPCG